MSLVVQAATKAPRYIQRLEVPFCRHIQGTGQAHLLSLREYSHYPCSAAAARPTDASRRTPREIHRQLKCILYFAVRSLSAACAACVSEIPPGRSIPMDASLTTSRF